MNQVQEIKSSNKKKDRQSLTLFDHLVPIVCVVSLICYLIFSHGLRSLLASWKYYLGLFNGIFPNGFLNGLPQHIPLIPSFSSLHNSLLFIGFLSCCVTSAWLAHTLFRGCKSELGPHLILFSLVAAIVPSLLMAIIFWPDGNGNLTLELALYASLFLVIVLAVLKMTISPMKKLDKPAPSPANHEPLTWAWAFLPLAALIFFLVYLCGSIAIVGSDALGYHLPLAASWFHTGSITRGFDIQYTYPGNAELLLRWGFLFNSDCFVFLIPYFAAILCIYMLYKLGRVIGQGRQPALVAACCVSTVPMIPFLASIANTDTLGVLFLLLSVFFLIRWIQSNLDENGHLFCAGLASGLAAGTKLSMLTSIFAISVVAIIAVFRSRRIWRITGPKVEDVGLNWRWLFILSGVFSAATLLGCGYWYLRNLIEHGNPFYPVSILGLPGYNMNSIVPLNPVFISSPWKRIFYPWTELTYNNPFDDGIGAVTAGVVIPCLIIWPFLRNHVKMVKRTGPGVIYFMACISLFLFAWSNIMYMRHGMFLILICFLFIGEFWLVISSKWFRAIIFSAFVIMTLTLAQSLAGGYLYTYLFNKTTTRTERLFVPDLVDTLTPTRIFNAVGAAHHTYGLMGKDFRHEVVTLFRGATPEDVLAFKSSYVLITKDQEKTFLAKLPLELVGTETKIGTPVSLWKVIQ
jgi:hypothetical protein